MLWAISGDFYPLVTPPPGGFGCGFRGRFLPGGNTWRADYPDGVREAALAHKYKSETTAAYQRGQKLEKRRVLMKDWAQFLEGSSVIRLGKVG